MKNNNCQEETSRCGKVDTGPGCILEKGLYLMWGGGREDPFHPSSREGTSYTIRGDMPEFLAWGKVLFRRGSSKKKRGCRDFHIFIKETLFRIPRHYSFGRGKGKRLSSGERKRRFFFFSRRKELLS